MTNIFCFRFFLSVHLNSAGKSSSRRRRETLGVYPPELTGRRRLLSQPTLGKRPSWYARGPFSLFSYAYVLSRRPNTGERSFET